MKRLKILFLFLMLLVGGGFAANAQVSVLFASGGTQGTNISTSGSLAPFANNTGTASTQQTFGFTGTLLTSSVVWGPATGMEFSPDGSTWASTVTFTQSGGNASGTVHLRVAAATAAGIYSGTVPGTTTGASAGVGYSATVSAGGTKKVVQVNLEDGTNGKMSISSWNDWNPANISFGQTVTSSAFTDSTGTATTITATLSIGQADNTANGFYTDNNAGYASATTSGFPVTVFRIPYLFTGGATTSSDTVRLNNLPTSSSNFAIEVISSRATATSRPQSWAIGATSISLDAQNNFNNVTGGHVPLFWTNISRDGNNQITIVVTYTNSFCFLNGFRITWTP